MSNTTRRALVRAFAKINLCLEVLNRRADGYHNIRTIFQSISLADTIELEWNPGEGARIALESTLDIPNNLVVRAAQAVLDETGAKGALDIRLTKKIPLGGGLGGGSTDAAAVLLALPVLTGQPVPTHQLYDMAATLGSDVPYFLCGGTVLGIGRGTELYPLPDARSGPLALICPTVHVSTPHAYELLNRRAQSEVPEPCASYPPSRKINNSQSLALALGAELPPDGWPGFCWNDFESAVFPEYPQLEAIRDRLSESGASPALMTGSGAALFGIFRHRDDLAGALQNFRKERAFAVRLIGRKQYRSMWRRQLTEHVNGDTWPLQSRYAE